MSPYWRGFLHENFCRPVPESYILPDGRPRLAYVDLAKGIAIIMVMLTHTHDFSPAGAALYRMPLYFMVCGMFFKDRIPLFCLLVSKTNRLLVPMVFFTTIGAFLYVALGRPLPEMSMIYSDPLAFIRIVNRPMWFLYTLFVAYILLWMVCSMFRSEIMRGILVCVLAFISAQCFSVAGAVGIFAAMGALPFIYAGYLLRHSCLLQPSGHDNALALGGAVAFCLVEWVAYVSGTSEVRFSVNQYSGFRPLIYLLAIVGTLSLLLVVKRVQWLPVLSYFGRYSVISLCIHFPLMVVAWELRYNCGWQWMDDPVFSILFFLILWLSIPFFVRYCPRFCAQRDLFRLHGNECLLERIS